MWSIFDIFKVAEAGGLSKQGLAGRALQALLLMEHTEQDDGLVRTMCDPNREVCTHKSGKPPFRWGLVFFWKDTPPTLLAKLERKF